MAKAIGFRGRGDRRSIGTPFDEKSEVCRLCGGCIYVCPACELRCTYTEPDKAVCGGCANLTPPCVEKETLRRHDVFHEPMRGLRDREGLTERKEYAMSATLSKVNASAATLTKNRTEGSVVPASGMCVTCVDGCIGMCEIGKSAYRGHEVIYPQPFGVITTAGEKRYPVDYSHFNIMGTAVGAHGIEADSDKAIFPAVNLEVRLGTDRASSSATRGSSPASARPTSPRTTGTAWPSARPWPAPA